MNKKNRNNSYAETRRRGMQYQTAQQRSQRTTAPAQAVIPQAANPRPVQRIGGLAESPLIAFVLRRHPQETAVDRLKKEFIQTSREITVRTLKVFLGKKLGYAPCSNFQIMATAEDNVVVLPDEISLDLVRRDIVDDPMADIIMHYRIFPRDKLGCDNVM